MTKKISRSIILVAVVALLAGLLIVITTLFGYFASSRHEQLSAQLGYAAAAVENEGENYFSSLGDGAYRLTLIAPDGTVIADTRADANRMENHAGREEVAQALMEGDGEASRYSKTLTEQTDYIARRLSDGTVLRISASHSSVVSLLARMLPPLLGVLLVSVVLAIVLAGRLSKSIVKPLNELTFDAPLDNDVYEELAPMLRHMDIQKKQINRQMEELQRMRSEFSAITANMSEGLVLLGSKGNIVSINAAAQRLFNTDGSSVGRDFLTIERTPEISRCVAEAMEGGSAEVCAEKSGKDYLFRVSGVLKGGDTIGAAVLIIDVTERMQGERIRREFTANVSHELKTPLQSIIGSADLIENGLVKPEDMSRFIGHIKTDAARLVTLIGDIIRLSQLDEGEQMPREPVELNTLAEDALEMLRPAADKRGVTISLEGASPEFMSVRQLCYEIIYNLCDNAICYNRDGGSVRVVVGSREDWVIITVSDTGIGISPEHQERIFERFYRVDKSHSRQTGGTGLGLSIVKHAVRYLSGRITLESRQGEGTSITVMLPRQ